MQTLLKRIQQFGNVVVKLRARERRRGTQFAVGVDRFCATLAKSPLVACSNAKPVPLVARRFFACDSSLFRKLRANAPSPSHAPLPGPACNAAEKVFKTQLQFV